MTDDELRSYAIGHCEACGFTLSGAWAYCPACGIEIDDDLRPDDA